MHFGDQRPAETQDQGETQDQEINATHELSDDFVDQGGVTLADYDAAETTRVEGFPDPVNELAFQATGTSDGSRDISDGERAVQAVRVDEAVRAHRAWIDSRPLDEQLRLLARPVITTPGA